jgi:hypothetical protein
MGLRFVGRDEELDRIAYPLAIEAALGVLAKGETLTEQAARDWIVAATGKSDPSKEILARSMNFITRIVSGPRLIEGAAHPLSLSPLVKVT